MPPKKGKKKKGIDIGTVKSAGFNYGNWFVDLSHETLPSLTAAQKINSYQACAEALFNKYENEKWTVDECLTVFIVRQGQGVDKSILIEIKNRLTVAEDSSLKNDVDTLRVNVGHLLDGTGPTEIRNKISRLKKENKIGDEATASGESSDSEEEGADKKGKGKKGRVSKKELKAQVASLEADLNRVTTERDAEKKRADDAERERDTARADLAAARQATVDVVVERDAARTDLATARKETDDQKTRADGAEARVTTLTGDLATAKQETVTEKALVVAAERERDTARAALAVEKTRADNAEARVTTLTGDLATARQETAAAKALVVATEAERDTAKAEVTTLKADLVIANQEKATAEANVVRLTAALAAAQAGGGGGDLTVLQAIAYARAGDFAAILGAPGVTSDVEDAVVNAMDGELPQEDVQKFMSLLVRRRGL